MSRLAPVKPLVTYTFFPLQEFAGLDRFDPLELKLRREAKRRLTGSRIPPLLPQAKRYRLHSYH